MIHGVLCISCSRNPKTPQICSFFYENWLLFGFLTLVSSYHIGKKECVRNVEKITESCENLRSLSHITLEKALLYHKKYKKTRKNALQEIDKKIQLCYN